MLAVTPERAYPHARLVHKERPMTEITDLYHVTKPLKNGGEIIILNPGALIKPEAQAMLAALHSRSVGGLRSHLDVLAKKGPDAFMESFYVRYGHKSIGDNAHIAVFIEGVSMLAAKAVQDFPLYNGQEASTRYIDFAKQKFLNPAGTEIGENILETLREFYLEGMAVMVPELTSRYPMGPDDDEKDYKKAIKARAFDTMRAFLPAGATTNLAWYGNVRQFGDRILTLRHHPLPEVRDIAARLLEAVLEAYPSSFSADRAERHPETEAYNAHVEADHAYFDDPNPVEFEFSHDGIDRVLLAEYRDALEKRPVKTELPFAIRECGTSRFRFLLDFGSFRDIQRHRAVITRMPLLTTRHGFEPWYLKELPSGLREKAEALLASQLQLMRDSFNLSPEQLQYYIPMGYRITIRMTGDLRGLVYLAEIRATSTVHPTLRIRAHQTAQELLVQYGDDGLVLHLDDGKDRFDIKRGTHDIEIKD
jgi:thymidylate synthase ThyX